MDKTITMQLANAETGDEYLTFTQLNNDGELVTAILQDNELIGVFTHIKVHDRFDCNTIYGNADFNEEMAERIEMLMIE